MDAKHDTVVIGGGVTGLAAGALLARDSRRVAVLEKGNQLGGRAYTYVDKGFTLNYGAHAMYRPHTGLLAQLLKRLGLPKIDAPYPNPRRAYFADDGRWGALGPMPQDVLGTSLVPISSRLRLLPLIGSLRLRDPEKLGDMTVDEWLEQNAGDEYVRRLIRALAVVNTYSRPAGALSAKFLLRHLKRNLFAKDYVGYMSKGWSTMYDAFASMIRERGGEIVTGAGVDRLVVEDGRVVAAVVGDRRFEADAFVVTAPPQEAPELADAGSPLRAELEQWRGLVDTRALCIDLGFSRRLRADERLTFIYDIERDLYFSLHSEVTPDLAPEGGQLLHAMAYLSPEEASDEALRESRHQELLAGLDQHFAGWREAAVVQRVLPNSRVCTARQTPDQQGPARVPLRSSVAANLYFAGDARDLPYNLTEICLASAIEVADAIAAAPAVARAREAVAV
jgi:phytoene dehydrogenase-like protein